MKVTPDHLDAMRELMAPLDTDKVRDAYRRGEFPRADVVTDLDRRYRWDLFYAAKAWRAFADAAYSDAHIETALKRTVPAL